MMADVMNDDKRIIKKYPNRRLYDTVESKYITLQDIRQLVLDNVEFCILDQKTGEDITRSILLQVIMEAEDNFGPIFTTTAMTRIIRCYGDTMQNFASEYLERSLALFTEQQKIFQNRLSDAAKLNPLTTMAELTQRNIELWRTMQNSFFKVTGFTEKDKPEPKTPDQDK